MAYKKITFESFNNYAKKDSIIPIRLQLPQQNVSWLIGQYPYKLSLSSENLESFHNLGNLCAKYHDFLDDLFGSSKAFQSVCNHYRNDAFIENYFLSKHKNWRHVIYRPDLVLSDDLNFKIAEIDGLPGQLGIHSFLLKAYLLEKLANEMLLAFKYLLSHLRLSSHIDFVIDAIALEDEYVAEYKFLARSLKEFGIQFEIFLFDQYKGPKHPRTFVYRFFDMVHNDQVKINQTLNEILNSGSYLYPPFKHYLEEKLSMGYLHNERTEDIAHKYFTVNELTTLRNHLPKVHYLDKTLKVIDPPLLGEEGSVIQTFEALVNQTPHVPYVLKTSGFSDRASKSKGTILLEGLSTEKLSYLFNEYIYRFNEHFIIQEKISPLTLSIPAFELGGVPTIVKGSSRLTPFYFMKNGGQFTCCSADLVVRMADDVHFAPDASVVPVY